MEVGSSSNDLLINEAIISNMKKSKEIILFIISLVLATIILLLFALPLVFPKISASLFSGRQIFAVPYQAEIVEGKVDKKIVWVEDIDFQELYPEMLIAVNYQDTYWIEEIVAIDYELEEVITSFNGTVARRYSLDDVAGLYNRDANLVGIFYYFASRYYGLIVIGLALSGSIYLWYRGFVKDINSHVKRFKDNSEYEKEN
jgi:hypothetical protein